MVQLLCTGLILVGCWFIYVKMGRQGWEGIVPFYNLYVLCEVLYGAGWKMLLCLIPLYNIYFAFKVNIDLAHKFNQPTGFGVGLTLLPFVFYPILGLGKAECTYKDAEYTEY